MLFRSDHVRSNSDVSGANLKFLTEEVLFGRKFSVESFEFLFLICKLEGTLALGTDSRQQKQTENTNNGFVIRGVITVLSPACAA